jgi:hypothetical protein
MPRPTKFELVDKIYRNALAALVFAVARQKVCHEPFSEHVKEAARNFMEAYESGQAVYKDNQWLVDRTFDEAITALVDAAVGQNVPSGPYSEHVYDAARIVAESYEDAVAVHSYRLTDLDEYEAERERRREIGLTIDPAAAEKIRWGADVSDPYDMLDPEKFHENCYGNVSLARNPGGLWVYCGDLPEATDELLWPRKQRTPEAEALLAKLELLAANNWEGFEHDSDASDRS